MFEFNELGELLVIPLALLASALLLVWCWPLRNGRSGGYGLTRLSRAYGLPYLVGSYAGPLLRSVQGLARGKPSSRNQSFDAAERDVLRRIDEDRKAFMQFRDEAERTREQAEFDAFVAERGKHRS